MIPCLKSGPGNFHNAALRIVDIGPEGLTAPESGVALADDYRHHGFALFRLTGEPEDPVRTLRTLASNLGLPASFVPPLYRGHSDLYADSGINLLSAETVPAEPSARHPAFQSRSPIEFHCDGTLQSAGEISTVILFCLLPAPDGGDTILFDAVGAFSALSAEDPELSAALLDERALARHATVGGSTEFRCGPVFSWLGGELVTRYSVTPRDRWAVDRVESLGAAKEALERLAEPGSPYFLRLRLEAGQGIILANDKISHGRTGFGEGGDRRMLRALYTSRLFAAGERRTEA